MGRQFRYLNLGLLYWSLRACQSRSFPWPIGGSHGAPPGIPGNASFLELVRRHLAEPARHHCHLATRIGCIAPGRTAVNLAEIRRTAADNTGFKLGIVELIPTRLVDQTRCRWTGAT